MQTKKLSHVLLVSIVINLFTFNSVFAESFNSSETTESFQTIESISYSDYKDSNLNIIHDIINKFMLNDTYTYLYFNNDMKSYKVEDNHIWVPLHEVLYYTKTPVKKETNKMLNESNKVLIDWQEYNDSEDDLGLNSYYNIVFQGFFKNPIYDQINRFLIPGKRTTPNDEIKQVASQINDKKDFSTIKEIINWMENNLKWVEENHDNKESFRKNRRAEDIINTKIITGCTDRAHIFITLVREKGIPAIEVQSADINWVRDLQRGTHVGIIGHYFVEIYLNDKWYLCDPTANVLYLDYDKNNFSIKNFYIFAKDVDNAEFPMHDETGEDIVTENLFKNFDLSKYKKTSYKTLYLGSQ